MKTKISENLVEIGRINLWLKIEDIKKLKDEAHKNETTVAEIVRALVEEHVA